MTSSKTKVMTLTHLHKVTPE